MLFTWMNLVGLLELALWAIGCIWFVDKIAPKLFDWAIEPPEPKEKK